MKTKIYALTEPNGVIRYIGKTCRFLQERLADHIAEAKYTKKDTYKCRWVKSLLSKRLYPKIQLINEVKGNGDAEEIVWIKFYREIGVHLVNTTDGGSGIIGLTSEDEVDLCSKCPTEPCTRSVGDQTAGVRQMICPECGLAFVGRKDKRFCSAHCKDAWHNAKKAFSVVLVPRAFEYVRDLAEARGITNNEMANEMILRGANPDGEPLGDEETYGVRVGPDPTEAKRK